MTNPPRPERPPLVRMRDVPRIALAPTEAAESLGCSAEFFREQVAQGHTNREIADALYLSPFTVKTHVSRILNKLDARDRVQLVVIAYQSGITHA